MLVPCSNFTATRLQWKQVYSESELYKAALRVYTKPLFQWRKALFKSTDGKSLYDLAGNGLRNLGAIHRALQRETFEFRPAAALHYNFNGKHRTLYIAPWEERIVDLLLYRVLNQELNAWFSPNTYAYRDGNFGLDRCQSRIAAILRSAKTPVYVVKRDIADYFASVNHELLLSRLAEIVAPENYLFRLLEQRVRFLYHELGSTQKASCGIPFGTAIACLFANIYLTEMDRRIEQIPDVFLFRYADDLLLLSPNADAAQTAAEHMEGVLSSLALRMKPSHSVNLVLTDNHFGKKIPQNAASAQNAAHFYFQPASRFRHLGLQFCADGGVALSRDKLRKLQNLFRFAFRRGRRRWQRPKDPRARAQVLIAIARETIEEGIRNVAILDYYLKHVDDEAQVRLLDRWLAEEVLSSVFGGHRKSHFRRIGFGELRAMGLPSLLHRRRLMLRGQIESPFFIWQREKTTRAFRGTVARLHA